MTSGPSAPTTTVAMVAAGSGGTCSDVGSLEREVPVVMHGKHLAASIESSVSNHSLGVPWLLMSLPLLSDGGGGLGSKVTEAVFFLLRELVGGRMVEAGELSVVVVVVRMLELLSPLMMEARWRWW